MSEPTFPQPVRPSGELRSQVVDHLVRRSLDHLERAEKRRQLAFAEGKWQGYVDGIRAHVSEAFGDMPFGSRGGSLNLQPVTSFDTAHCKVENVLFESYPGWEVNASVFVPYGAGPFPAVVIPVGHSGKQYDNYQIPAQAFASLGFVAVLFDPPGQDSEKKPGNDHFGDGVRTFLTGRSSSRYFVLDALRCIDYLETRPDVELGRGVGMTGVSGGGHTTLLASLFDERITCQGPSCCINRMADHPVGDGYSACPESLWSGRLAAGVDEIDLLLAGIPIPTLYMAGRGDEVFRIDWSRALADRAAECFGLAGYGGRFRFFEDESGHAYTLAQVEQFTAWMNQWMLEVPDRDVPHLDPADFSMLEHDQLQCHPAAEENTFTLNRAIARELSAKRQHRVPTGAGHGLVTQVVGTPGPVAAHAWQESDGLPVWMQEYREALFRAEGLDIPATLLSPVEAGPADRKWVIFIDDGGRRRALESGGPATQTSRLLERSPVDPHPVVVVPDLPGWGDSTPGLVPYALAGWGSMDRLTAYLSCALGDGILAIQTRCAAALISHVAERGVALANVVVVGRGLGGAVALMAAALTDAQLGGVVSWSCLGSFQMLAEAEQYAWPAGAFLPDVLTRFDLPELAASLRGSVRILDPLDAARQSLSATESQALFGPAGESLRVVPQCDSRTVVAAIQELLR